MTIVDIKKLGEVAGRDGQAQWELKVKWPWTVGNNEDTVWMDQGTFDKPNLGPQAVTVTRRGIKKNRDKVPYDGRLDWMWNWSITDFGKDSQTPPNPMAGQAPQNTKGDTAAKHGPGGSEIPEPWKDTDPNASAIPIKDPLQTRIEIGMAFNAAYTLIASRPNAWDADLAPQIRELRDELYHEVIQVPVAPPHFCYEHETIRIQGPSGGWGHPIEEEGSLVAYCIEGRGIVQE